MSYVTLAQAKAHLLVIHSSDDELIQLNIDAAEAYAAGYMNRPDIADDPVTPWKTNQPCAVVSSEAPNPVPKSVVQAILLLTADYYENRTPVSIAAMGASTNVAAENLLWQQRIGLGV